MTDDEHRRDDSPANGSERDTDAISMVGSDARARRSSRVDRRGVLAGMAAAGLAPIGLGVLAYWRDRRFADEAGDGIPDSKQRSASFNRRLEERFGTDQFGGLDPGRRDFLVDVRYVGNTSITDETVEVLRRRFRENDIAMQWLEYPRRYSLEWLERTYGTTVSDLLLDRDGFYHEEVEHWLKDVALQLVVLPRRVAIEIGDGWIEHVSKDIETSEPYEGFSVGNRAVVIEQRRPSVESRLVLHEIGHLVLCHDDDPDNDGVMGPHNPADRVDFTDEEWTLFRDTLGNVRDTTGFDVAFRRCLWERSVVEPVRD